MEEERKSFFYQGDWLPSDAGASSLRDLVFLFWDASAECQEKSGTRNSGEGVNEVAASSATRFRGVAYARGFVHPSSMAVL